MISQTDICDTAGDGKPIKRRLPTFFLILLPGQGGWKHTPKVLLYSPKQHDNTYFERESKQDGKRWQSQDDAREILSKEGYKEISQKQVVELLLYNRLPEPGSAH